MLLTLVRKAESYVRPRGPEGGLAAEYLPLRTPAITHKNCMYIDPFERPRTLWSIGIEEQGFIELIATLKD